LLFNNGAFNKSIRIYSLNYDRISHRYSKYIRPFSIFCRLSGYLVNGFTILNISNINLIYFIVYEIDGFQFFFSQSFMRYIVSHPSRNYFKIVTRYCVRFDCYCLFPFSIEAIFSVKDIVMFIISSLVLVTLSKFLLFYYLKEYRIARTQL
jgi:putative colanic acid biosynthesis UDP-glucose lipid carrier transferase